MRLRPSFLRVLCVLLCATFRAHADAPVAPQWQPIQDTSFLQEIGSTIEAPKPIWAVASYNGSVFTGSGDGVRRLGEDGALVLVPDAPQDYIERMRVVEGRLWVFGKSALYVFDKDSWRVLAKGRYSDVTAFAGKTIVASRDGLFEARGDQLVPLPGGEVSPGPIQALANYSETLYCLAYDRIFTFDGLEFGYRDTVEFGAFPSKDLRDLLAVGSRLYVASHAGLGVLQGSAATQILGSDGLPHEEGLVLAPGLAGDFWFGTTRGAIRVNGDEFHYFSGPRWLLDDNVNDITTHEDAVYIGTNDGLGIIRYVPFTLQKKAAYYEQHLTAWGQKRMAFTHKLERDGSAGRWVREVSDNDVGWSTHYWASQAFKYAATGDQDARAEAVSGFNAMKWSEEITSIDGFPARSIWAVGETGNQAQGGSGGYPAEWNPTEDGRWAWKGDTSSDETDAHFYYAAIFHDLVADAAEKKQVRDHVHRLMSHIMDNGWLLRDTDGKPTVWGRWDPEYFASEKGNYARGLNGLEILSYLRTAIHITGDAKFEEGLAELIGRDYHREVIRQKLLEPGYVFHSDDRLAFYAYYPLLQYETDPYLRSHYRRSLARSFEIERIEHIPWFNFIYGATTGNDCETAEAVKHLREWPLDLVSYDWNNTYRTDLLTPAGYIPYAGGGRPYSPRSRGPIRWTDSSMELKGGKGGQVVVDPSGWLDAYWMGRYYGMILAPTTEESRLLNYTEVIGRDGAAPYDGPPMPDVLKD
jgi:hypothetical protein